MFLTDTHSGEKKGDWYQIACITVSKSHQVLAEWWHPDRHGDGDGKWTTTLRKLGSSFPNQTVHLSYDPGITVLHIYLREGSYFHSGTNILMFIAGLFVIVNSELMNSVSERLNKL